MKLPLLLQLLPLLSRPDMTALPPIVCCIVLPLHFLNRAWTAWLLQLGRCPVDLPPQPPRTFVCLEILIRCRSILYSQTFVLQRRGPSPATNSSPTLKLFFQGKCLKFLKIFVSQRVICRKIRRQVRLLLSNHAPFPKGKQSPRTPSQPKLTFRGWAL